MALKSKTGKKRPEKPQLPVKDKHVTLQDIADYCGISKCSVSLALRGKPPISEATRTMILKAVDILGYQAGANESARRLSLLKQGKRPISNIIALFMAVVPIETGNYHNNLFHGVLDGLMEEEYGLLILHTPSFYAASSLSPLWSIFSRGDVDGVIYGHAVDPELSERLRANPGFSSNPIVRLINDQEVDSLVCSDDKYGSYVATKHLLALGHRYFCQCIFPIEYGRLPGEIEARIEGIESALMEAQLPLEQHLIYFPYIWEWNDPATSPQMITDLNMPGELDEEQQVFIEFLHKHPEITAIFGVNDANALHAWRALSLAGYKVPEDYSLVGFDDTDTLFDDKHQNQLSSIHVPLRQIGTEAAHLVVRHVVNPDLPPTTVMLPIEFIPRKSIGNVRG